MYPAAHRRCCSSVSTSVSDSDRAHDEEDFVQPPHPPEGTIYDRSDRKFLAVAAAAHEEHPPILQSFDSKWWGWREAVDQVGISVHFLPVSGNRTMTM